MPELNEYRLCKWFVVTDKGEYPLSEDEMRIFLEADSRGARFVMFDKFLLNVAFVKEAYKKYEIVRTPALLSEGDKKYLVSTKELE